ncbi:type III pantothenate kinase [Pararobbsia alpina]|uniref:Type III pantothenate kinase n=1 Tax=Pararobbsia alpina TaxID=621374 RepID=A0A6S7BEX4_9BURK|nr:type III pantothenate kinase [Pararobbsia alpina]CAB3788796.1 Type III pantothenate kinase [Pararobbsia alpina]
MSRALLVDAGNSRVKWALVEGSHTLADGVFVHGEEASERSRLAALPRPAAAWVSNVAGPEAAARIGALIEAVWPGLECRWVRAQAKQAGITNGYAEPSQLGSDRWCGMIGARAAYPGEHLLIATLGTATTVEALHADGRFIGGLIAPGWTLMMQSLGQHTAQLPSLDAVEARQILQGKGETKGKDKAAAEHIGSTFACDTRSSLGEGCRIAQTAFIEHAWHDAAATFGSTARCLLSGGAADAVSTRLRIPFTRHEGLVLAGLAWIAAAPV